MKILLIEDDEDKINKIELFLREDIVNIINITKCMSYNSALIELVRKKDYDFVLMDMSMPIYDINDYEEEDPESFAGRDLLEQMKFRDIRYPTIVITQYDTFGEHIKLSLDELKNEMKEKFAINYKATVYYNSSENDWKPQLKKEILNIMSKKGK